MYKCCLYLVIHICYCSDADISQQAYAHLRLTLVGDGARPSTHEGGSSGGGSGAARLHTEAPGGREHKRLPRSDVPGIHRQAGGR